MVPREEASGLCTRGYSLMIGCTAFCRGQIAHYKVLHHIRFVPEFPPTVTGKVQKFQIRAAMIEDLELYEEQTV